MYVHRSGRTARANTTGVAVSLVAPDDVAFHNHICQQLATNKKSLEALKVDLTMLPLLRERVSLAKKIFTQSFVESQQSKERMWLESTAREADLDIDEDELELLSKPNNNNHNSSKQQKKKSNDGGEGQSKSKKELQAMRAKLKALLDTPLEMYNRGASSRRTGFIVVAK